MHDEPTGNRRAADDQATRRGRPTGRRGRRPDPVGQVRQICLAFPEAVEKPFGGHTAPSFRVRDKLFVMTSEDGTSLTCKAPPGGQQALVSSNPERFFVPAYVGAKGWVGVHLDGPLEWEELAEIIEDSYRLTAPKRLVSRLGQDIRGGPGDASGRDQLPA